MLEIIALITCGLMYWDARHHALNLKKASSDAAVRRRLIMIDWRDKLTGPIQASFSSSTTPSATCEQPGGRDEANYHVQEWLKDQWERFEHLPSLEFLEQLLSSIADRVFLDRITESIYQDTPSEWTLLARLLTNSLRFCLAVAPDLRTQSSPFHAICTYHLERTPFIDSPWENLAQFDRWFGYQLYIMEHDPFLLPLVQNTLRAKDCMREDSSRDEVLKQCAALAKKIRRKLTRYAQVEHLQSAQKMLGMFKAMQRRAISESVDAHLLNGLAGQFEFLQNIQRPPIDMLDKNDQQLPIKEIDLTDVLSVRIHFNSGEYPTSWAIQVTR